MYSSWDMITDEKLAKISLVLAVIGIIAIYLSITLPGPERLKIESIDEKDSGRLVSVNGTINSISASNGNIFIGLEDATGNITVVMFERTARGQKVYELQENDSVVVDGQVGIYKSELEIIASKIENRKTP